MHDADMHVRTNLSTSITPQLNLINQTKLARATIKQDSL